MIHLTLIKRKEKKSKAWRRGKRER